MGANVPDLRGLFLRGNGGNAAGLGAVQEDAGRNITGTVQTRDDVPAPLGVFWNATGAFNAYGGGDGGRIKATRGSVAECTLQIDAARIWGSAHVANEFRPRNRAVRYLIRAKS